MLMFDLNRLAHVFSLAELCHFLNSQLPLVVNWMTVSGLGSLEVLQFVVAFDQDWFSADVLIQDRLVVYLLVQISQVGFHGRRPVTIQFDWVVFAVVYHGVKQQDASARADVCVILLDLEVGDLNYVHVLIQMHHVLVGELLVVSGRDRHRVWQNTDRLLKVCWSLVLVWHFEGRVIEVQRKLEFSFHF